MACDAPIAIVGAGRMGRGIALALAYAGHDVALIDLKPRTADETAALAADMHREIAGDLAFLSAVDALEPGGDEAILRAIRFVPAADAAAAVADAAMLFEGVPETMEAKRACIEWINARVPADCIVASTSSTIDADTLAAMVAHPGRFLNAHWLNPAHIMPLVELGAATVTDDATIAHMRAFLIACGKVPVLCRSAPGYIVPRIQALAMNEAARMVEEGVATAEDIDTAIRVGFGPRFAVLGLLEFIDWGGGDILHHASGFLADRIDARRFAAPAVIRDNMANRRRGLRDGRGFYDYAGVDLAAYRSARMHAFVDLLRSRDLMPTRIVR